MARKAKADGSLTSVTSYGGKIKVRKTSSDIPCIIYTENQLQAHIDDDDDTINAVNNASIIELNDSTPNNSNKQTHQHSNKTEKKQ